MKPKKQRLENSIEILAKQNLGYHEFILRFSDIEEISSLIDVRDLDMWRTLGLDIARNEENEIELGTRFRDIGEQEFCVVDIETTGGTMSGQIIEIGAIKMKNGVEIGRFESCLAANDVP